HGAALECMTTAAACRTYALLASEGRKVWAWLWV
ncbi:MAG: rod shape-determining protein RodA, partial [Kingella sp. (in: b-proteobacteria)]